jgi:tetratricopeptide (TPR) repeat protein
MRSVFAFSIAVILCGALPASAQDGLEPEGEVIQDPAYPAPAPEPEAVAPTDKAAPLAAPAENRLDKLFADLKRERNERKAERISQQIWNEWFRSGSASIDLMMQWAAKATEDKKFDVALDFLDQVVVMEPDFAEGWNRRATVHFMMNNFSKSMADIEHTLRLEPRHFGALSGMAQILRNRGSDELALQVYQRVLDIYPMMRSAQNEVATLSEELAGEGI